MDSRLTVNVHKDSLINYRNCKYSVPSKYINKTVTLNVTENELHIYFRTDLIAIHELSDKKINYLEDHYEDHYKELLSVSMKKSEDIDILAMDNLNQLDGLVNLNGGINE